MMSAFDPFNVQANSLKEQAQKLESAISKFANQQRHGAAFEKLREAKQLINDAEVAIIEAQMEREEEREKDW